MKIKKITIQNYRLLQDFKIDIEDELSLVIGKNNTGKTSLLSILEKFLISEKNNFSFDDINISCQENIVNTINNNEYYSGTSLGIEMKIYIEYDEEDNLENISSFMLNLDPDSRIVILGFSYKISFEQSEQIKKDYNVFIKQEQNQDKEQKSLFYYLGKNHKLYFKLYRTAHEHGDLKNFIIVEKKQIDKLINFKRINAKREVKNSDITDNKTNKTLSKLSSEYYEKLTNKDVQHQSAEELKSKLSDTDKSLNKIYDSLFKSVISKIKKFGGVKEDESVIKIISQLEEKNILRENTSVVYSHSNKNLPEDYNGLGYMNLIAMIFEIEVILNDFKKRNIQLERPSDINLFFIEEPEAHTHPQMQYVFIKNIKTILQDESKGGKDGIAIQLQTIITTHSPQVVAESDSFDDIKYFLRINENAVIAKNLRELKAEYGDTPKHYQFLKQYLTLTKAELFFADKAILIEGDTERILLPTIMKKLDKGGMHNDIIPLLSQNITIIEVGAYSQIFEKFIDFIGIKSLIITDIDSVDVDGKSCRVSDGVETKNSAISYYFHSELSYNDLQKLEDNKKCFNKNPSTKVWEQMDDGILKIVYQIEENGYTARSFEDAFIHINKEFIQNSPSDFRGIKNSGNFNDSTYDSYALAESCIKKKTYFALDIIYFSNDDYSNWKIPKYIKNGLLWLQK